MVTLSHVLVVFIATLLPPETVCTRMCNLLPRLCIDMRWHSTSLGSHGLWEGGQFITYFWTTDQLYVTNGSLLHMLTTLSVLPAGFIQSLWDSMLFNACLQAEAVLSELQPLLSSPSDITVMYHLLSLFQPVLLCSVVDGYISVSYNPSRFTVWRLLPVFAGVISICSNLLKFCSKLCKTTMQ